MSEQDGFDARLAAHFEREHRHVPADDFVAATMEMVRAGRRRGAFMRVGWRVGALGVAVVASPWVIAGVDRVSAALESSVGPVVGQYGMWVLGAMVVAVVLGKRLRSRSHH
jgi:hypothetical protein